MSLVSQEPASRISEFGTAFWYGLALGGLVVYIPLLAIGLAGHILNMGRAQLILSAALGITVYWPVVCLAARFRRVKAPTNDELTQLTHTTAHRF